MSYRFFIVLLLAIMLCPSFGCVRRRLTIRTNPPGALVLVDDQEIGLTPVSTAFTYYGTRKIQLIRDGYETITVKQKFPPPWYEYVGLDFVSENLYPGELRDERVLEFQLVPQQVVPTESLLERAQGLRSSAQQGIVTPLLPTNFPAPQAVPALPPGEPIGGTFAPASWTAPANTPIVPPSRP